MFPPTKKKVGETCNLQTTPYNFYVTKAIVSLTNWYNYPQFPIKGAPPSVIPLNRRVSASIEKWAGKQTRQLYERSETQAVIKHSYPFCTPTPIITPKGRRKNW